MPNMDPDRERSARKLPAGWWECVPENLRALFDRKVLRHGYLLNEDKAVTARNFFRQVQRGVIRDVTGEFTCVYRYRPKATEGIFRANAACTCKLTVAWDPCSHLAALLFNVFSGPAVTVFSEGYSASPWSHLALCLCRSHAHPSAYSMVQGPRHTEIHNEQGTRLLKIGTGNGSPIAWQAERLFPSEWEITGGSSGFLGWARDEISLEEHAKLKTMRTAPSLRAEFGPVGELCRKAFLHHGKIEGKIDWSFTERCFHLHLENARAGLIAFARLDADQAYSMHKKFPAVRLGEGFAAGRENSADRDLNLDPIAWRKGLEIRVEQESCLRIRPFAARGPEERFFPPSDGGEIWFGDQVLLGENGFFKVETGDSPLLKKYLGWKSYSVMPEDVPGFMEKFGRDLSTDPNLDLDPLITGSNRGVQIQDIILAVRGLEGSSYRVQIEYRTGDGLPGLDTEWLKLQWDSKTPAVFTLGGWVDFTSYAWSWLEQVKPEQWLRTEDGLTLKLDQRQLFRICALHRPRAVRLGAGAIYPELNYIASLGRETASPPVANPPPDSDGLRPYQKEGLQWLWNLVSCGVSGLLADDMGLGKTHQVMALLAWNHRHTEGKAKTLIVCPTSVLYHWKSKLESFYPEMSAVVFHGADRDRKALDNVICITSYGIVRNEISRLRESGFSLLILDEIQYLKNRDSETHKVLRDFPVRSMIGMTGTPLENSPSDVKNLFDLILPGYFPGEAEFRKSILDPITSGASGTRSDQARANFFGLCRPFILRRAKAEVLTDLPDKVEETSYCDLAEGQAELYREVLIKQGGPLLNELWGSQGTALLHVFQLLSHLKQICNHPQTLAGGPADDRAYPSGKWDLFVFLLEQALEAGHKVVVFSQYLAMLKWMESHLEKNGIGYATLTGATRNRETVLARFAADPACRVFCCSLKAGGVGIDLTAASTVIHYDRWWNAARENQATDRVHRIGQNRNVQVFKLVTRDTIEEKIDAIIRRKAAWMDSLLPNDAEGGLKLFTREELADLLSPGG